MKKRLGIIASILTVCMLTLNAFAASTSVTISKGQGSVTSNAVGLSYSAKFKAENYSSSVEIMQAYGLAGVEGKNYKVVWQRSIDPGNSKGFDSVSVSGNSLFKIQIVGSYYCNGKGTVST